MADQHAQEMDAASEAAARRIRDRICALWINRALRFGSVAAHFPRSLRCRRFVASFWAPEVLLFGDFYLQGFTRGWCDQICALLVERAGPALRPSTAFRDGYVALRRWLPVVQPDLPHGGVWQEVDTGKPRFWSPELPEIVRLTQVGGLAINGWPALRWIATLLLLLCLALPAGAQTLIGVVSRVTDGDTLVVGETRIRLFGIDAPEGKQECVAPTGKPYRCGDTAKGFLTRLAPPGTAISCEIRDTDRYGRLVAVCVAGGRDLSLWMVRAGWAVAYRKYSAAYVAEELLARAARRGIWAGTFVSPEEWRHAH